MAKKEVWEKFNQMAGFCYYRCFPSWHFTHLRVLIHCASLPMVLSHPTPETRSHYAFLFTARYLVNSPAAIFSHSDPPTSYGTAIRT